MTLTMREFEIRNSERILSLRKVSKRSDETKMDKEIKVQGLIKTRGEIKRSFHVTAVL